MSLTIFDFEGLNQGNTRSEESRITRSVGHLSDDVRPNNFYYILGLTSAAFAAFRARQPDYVWQWDIGLLDQWNVGSLDHW